MRKQKLVSDSIYHVFNRGVEKRRVFMDEHDYSRFVNNLAIFNDVRAVLNAKYRIKEIKSIDNREPLIDILAFCLMPNHFHLLLRQKEDNGISKFMNKIGVGYTNYFNLKYERVGPLFQGAFKSILIDKEPQFLYIPYYIHLNPLDLIIPNWRENGVNKLKTAVEFLDSYKWSSHRDYIGKSNFIEVLNKQPLNEFFVNPINYQNGFNDFIKDFNFSDIKINLMQNSAVSFSVCVDNDPFKIPGLIEALKKDFRLLYNENLKLVTVRHYFASTIDTLTKGQTILLEQRSRQTAQIVLKA